MTLLADPVGDSNVDDGIPVVHGLVADGQRPRTFNIDYIQKVQPRVGLVLADWLDQAAIHVEGGSLRSHPMSARALAVADAILGDRP